MIRSLKNRVLAFFLLLAVLIVSTVFPLNYLHRKKEFFNRQQVSQLNDIYIQFIKDLKCTGDFLSNETTNSVFFITGESPYLSIHEQLKDAIRMTFSRWENQDNFLSPLDKEQVNILAKAYQAFCNKFDSIVYHIYKRGYRNMGIEGEMLSYIYHAEKIPKFREYTYEFRNIERDYLNRYDSVNAMALLAMLHNLDKKIAKSSRFNPEEKDRINSLLNSYHDSFEQLALIDKKLGLKADKGLKQLLLQEGDALEMQINLELNRAREREIIQTSRLNAIFLIVTFLLLVFTVCISNYLSRYLVSHLEKLAKYISQLAAQNFSYTDEKLNFRNASKEIREIYTEFRQMVAQLRIREKQRNDALADAIEKEKRYRELTELLPQSVFETDRLGNIVYANKAWYKAFEYIREDIEEGLNLIEILQTNTTSNLFGIDKVENSDYIAIRKGGNRFPALVYSSVIQQDEKIMGRRGIIIDATLRNKYIETLQKETERAVNSDRLKSSFLANMSHEIRTPMNSIIGFSNLLLADEIPKEQKIQFIRHIQSSGQLLLNLIDDIIDIAKIEAGEIRVKPASCDPRKLIQDLKNTFEGYKSSIGKRDIEIIIHLPAEEVVFKTDPFRLKQIITNLISNAIKFTEKGSVNIACEIKNNRVIEFSVRDTGIGMTKEEMNMVFRRFQRAGTSEEKNISGTGLGLWISKSLVELLGGQMWVSSIPGEGTRFWFQLPFTHTIDTGSPVPAKNTGSGNAVFNWEGCTILVAEDDDNSYVFFKEILKRTKANIIHAINGKEAVEAVNLAGNIDLVLMDIQMPILDGYAAAKEIKKSFPNLPIIAQTAYAMDGDREKSILAGCDDYITKPVDPIKLLEKINQFLPSFIREGDLIAKVSDEHGIIETKETKQ